PSSQPSVGNGATSSAPAPTPVGASPSPLSGPPPPPPPSRVLPPVGSYACQPPPYPPPKKKSGLRSCLVALLVLVVLMAIVLTPLLVGGYFLLDSFSSDFQLAKAMSSSRTMSRHKSIRTVVMRPGSGDRIAVIGVKGMIVNTNARYEPSANRIIDALKAAVKDEVCAIILDMDTPGGEVTASDEILHQVKACRKAGIPVVTCMRSMAASGGYYIAAGSDWIVANRLTFTGSIGVIMPGFNAGALLDKIGVAPEVYRSGDMKDMLNWSRPRTDKERAYVQSLVATTFREFAAVVADGREAYEDAEAVMKADFADGRVLTGAEALRYQLVDKLGYFDDAVAKAEELAETSDAELVEYSTMNTFLDVLMSMRSDVRANPLRSVLPWQGVAVEAGRLYFVAPETLAWQ
ncbi:MAG TPA: signal peptide peptidase SppA, partial [Lentisphaeria bacterium]|nr:signal peptide peptidase SppA [Lentisphaeria bacterium]